MLCTWNTSMSIMIKNTALRNSLLQRKKHYSTMHQNWLVACKNINQNSLSEFATLTWKHLVLFLVLDWTGKLWAVITSQKMNQEFFLLCIYLNYSWEIATCFIVEEGDKSDWIISNNIARSLITWAFCATELSLHLIGVLCKKRSALKVNGVRVV